MFARTLGSTSRLVSHNLASSSRTTVARLSTATETAASSSTLVEVLPVSRPIILSLTPPLCRKSSDPKHEQHVVSLDPTVFDHPIRRDILHLCVTHYRDSLRQGSANTKTRGEVAGSGRKVRPQKGSGKARLGDAQSPMLVGGGVAFGPKPRDFSTKLPRKVIQMGMRVALSARMRENRMGVMTSMDWPSAKTGPLSRKIDELGLRKTLFITGEETAPAGLSRALANIPSVKLTTAKDVNVYEILYWQRVVLDVKAAEYFEETLKKDVPLLPLPLLESTSA
ncbi:ribosomal protein L4 [Macrolepiota fuliginosa MF-IS2]|uniref:Large ribosomal subunit protein uL4m n=1 Tax=Macrolepiota fuliginosa MF-IS2 TaxID=1400762 RepID=A0A9P6CAJ7_9AGAR|nr:ribosomal protein L4 [Macrolepiota fuliginosa MF-IS2]